jgi:hypothetical protein
LETKRKISANLGNCRERGEIIIRRDGIEHADELTKEIRSMKLALLLEAIGVRRLYVKSS